MGMDTSLDLVLRHMGAAGWSTGPDSRLRWSLPAIGFWKEGMVCRPAPPSLHGPLKAEAAEQVPVLFLTIPEEIGTCGACVFPSQRRAGTLVTLDAAVDTLGLAE